MSSKQSAKQSPASPGYRENKAKGYLEPAFIRELRVKAVQYYIGADQFKSSAKTRRPKETVEDQLFQAISYIRRRGWAEQKLLRDLAPANQNFERFSVHDALVSNNATPKGLIDVRDDLLGPKDEEREQWLAREFISAVRQGSIGRLNDIVEYCRIFESKTYGRPSEQPAERKRDLVPWHYYAAMGALRFLKQGIIPTRHDVKEAARSERAIDECSVIQGVRKPKKMRADPEPKSGQDVASYYDLEQGEHDPSPEATATPDLSAKERKRLKQGHRKQITALLLQKENAAALRQQQREGVRSSELARKPGEKSELEKDREKQIAAKKEELRSRQPKNWKRIFIDLGLDQLAAKR